MAIISRKYAHRLVKQGRAKINGYTVDGARYPEYMTIDRYDCQRVDHYRVTDADSELIRRVDAAA